MLDKGIVLLTMARSRSSMTAEIFREHGVFFGRTWRPEDKRVGYNEHIRLKEIGKTARPNCYRDILTGMNPELRIRDFPQWWEQILNDEGYEGGPWGVKVDVFCSSLFDKLPHHKIGLWRNPGGILESCLRALGRYEPEEWEKIIEAHHREIRTMRTVINTDAVVNGFHGTIENAFRVCGLEYDRSIAEQVIRK